MEAAQAVDYGDSRIRLAFSWFIYPLLVLLPFFWLANNLDVENISLLLAFSYFSLLTTLLAERIHPYARKWQHSQGDLLADIAHLFLTLFFAQLLRVFLVVGFFVLLNRTEEDFQLLPWPGQWPLWAQAILGLLITEFVDYWRHRFFHSWSAAWRLHAVHHSPKRVYFLNANRFHIFEACINSLTGAIALTLCGATTEVAILTGIFTGLHGPWQHANINYKLGWLNWIIAGAELHRWHHSTQPGPCNSNYGNNLIIFDTLFGTRYLPNTSQNLEQIGLDGAFSQYPLAWWRQQLEPFRSRATENAYEE